METRSKGEGSVGGDQGGRGPLGCTTGCSGWHGEVGKSREDPDRGAQRKGTGTPFSLCALNVRGPVKGSVCAGSGTRQ